MTDLAHAEPVTDVDAGVRRTAIPSEPAADGAAPGLVAGSRLSGHAGVDRRVLRSLQRKAGNRAVARLVARRSATRTVQRQPPGAPPAPTGAPAPALDAETQRLLEDEEKAWNALQGKVGAQALYVWLGDPVDAMVRRNTTPDVEVLTVGGLLDRGAGDPKRRSFDTPGPATAFAAGSGGGAVVVKQDRFFFAARLNAASNFVPEKVWKVRSYFPVEAAIGANGFRFPLDVELTRPDQNKGGAAKFTDPNRAEPADASGMRAIAGVKSDEDIAAEAAAAQKAKAEGKAPPDPKNPERAKIPPEKQEAFIQAYFRARAMEVLNDNQAAVEKLEKDFAPTNAAEKDKGVSPNAQALIDSTKKFGPPFRQLLENEALAEKYYQLVTQRISFRYSATKVKVEGREMLAVEAKHQLNEKIKQLKADKDAVLAAMPMLAMMVDAERGAPKELSTPEKVLYGIGGGMWTVGQNLQTLWSNEIDKPTLYGRNQYDASSFGKGASDEELRKEFYEKIASVKGAVREAKARTLTEGPGFLFGMRTLRMRVLADLAANPELKAKADEILKTHDLNETVINVGLLAIQIGLLFVPGGQLLSAAVGVGQSAYELNKHLKEWDYAKASVDPTKALVDQQEAADTVFWDTVFLAASAADFGGSVIGAATKGEKALTEAEEMAKKMGAKPYARPKVSPKKLLGEAEEDAFKRPQDVPPDVLKPVEIKKPEPGALSDAGKAQMGQLGITFTAKGLPESIEPLSILARAKGSWNKVKSVLLTGFTSPADKAMGAFIMQNMVAYRQKVTYGLLKEVAAEVDAARGTSHSIEAVGSTELTSDLDFSVKGPHASEVVERFNARFRTQFADIESAVAFDTNIYTNPAFLEAPIHLGTDGAGVRIPVDPKDAKAIAAGGPEMWEKFKVQARKGAAGGEAGAAAANAQRIDQILLEAEKLYPNDLTARIAHVNNFQQEAAAHMKAADTMLGGGPAGLEQWQKYKESVLSATPAGKKDHVRAVLAEAEARTMSYQDEVLAELNKGRPKEQWFTREQLAEMAHGGASTDPAKQRAYNEFMRARTTLYERKLGKVAAKQKEYNALKPRYQELKAKLDAGTATQADQFELMQVQGRMQALAADIGGAQSEALYFAAEAYQTEGSLMMVVQNAQKAKGAMSSPAFGSVLASRARDACFENLGSVIAHSSADLGDTVKAGKYLQRANYAYMAHPLASGSSPGVMTLVGQVLAAKGAGEAAQIEKIVARYGPPKEQAIARFAADIQAAGAQIRGSMAKVSGQPIPNVEAAWQKALDSGRAGTLVQYAAIAGGKAGGVSVAAGSE